MSREQKIRVNKLSNVRQQLVVNAYETGFRRMIALLKRWGAWIPHDEVRSLVGLGLSEAAVHFDKSFGVPFDVYAFHYIRGEVIKCIKERQQKSTLEEGFDDISESIEDADRQLPIFNREAFCPEQRYQRERNLREVVKVVKKLDPISADLLIRVDLFGEKLAHVARDLSYSRGHASELRRRARKTVRAELGESYWKLAA